MIELSQLKRGVYVVHKGAPMVVVDVTLSTPTARGASTIARTKLRNLLTGQLYTESFRSGARFDEVNVRQKPVDYLYSDGTRWHFMDAESFEQFDLGAEDLGEATGFLADGVQGLRATEVDDRIVDIVLPTTVDLTVTETDPAIKGATATAQTKRAVLETGIEIQVPPYLEAGERIRVDTRDGHFVGRVKE
jgi:elongation factor P